MNESIDAELTQRSDSPVHGTRGHDVVIHRRLLAWAVHLFTASGVIFCLLSLEATMASVWRMALVWLLAAVVIDAIDGSLARWVGVKEIVPNFDGTLLDNLVDYTSYVIVPALIIHRAELLPPSASFAAACAICLSSAYQFCQHDAKTPDDYFKGFPSYWNVTALYLLAMGLCPPANLVIVIALVLLVFVPVRYVYVTRTKPFRAITWPLTVVWSVMALGILWRLPHPPLPLVWASLLYVVYYVALSVYLTFQPRPQAS